MSDDAVSNGEEAMTSNERIGFIGLGAMGKPMALLLQKAGYRLTVMNRSPGPVDELVSAGATAGATPADVAAQSDVVVTMLPVSEDVEAVVFGADGMLSGARGGMLYIDMSSIAPATSQNIARACAEKDVACVDAPVSGGVKGAQEGSLAIMVGGDAGAVERARPVLDVLGRKVTHVGPAGAGQVAKIANQVIVAGTIALVGEALSLAQAAGVDGARVIDALEGGFADSAILKNHGRRMLEEQFAPGFRLQLQLKDVRLASALAGQLGLVLEVTTCVEDAVAKAVEKGFGDLDHAALVKVVGSARQP
jgi:2-hydroxy-3-oxopropionate reductase